MTAPPQTPRFGVADVIQIASKLTADDDAFVVGGQATNLWAWFYRDREPELRSAEPLTSVDLDYFGSFEVARRFAEAIGGKVRRPGLDDMNTPNTAVVEARLNGKSLLIDFLNDILGMTRRELRRGVSVIEVAAPVDGVEQNAEIAVLHPLLCLKSRVANMLHPASSRSGSRSAYGQAALRGSFTRADGIRTASAPRFSIPTSPSIPSRVATLIITGMVRAWTCTARWARANSSELAREVHSTLRHLTSIDPTRPLRGCSRDPKRT